MLIGLVVIAVLVWVRMTSSDSNASIDTPTGGEAGEIAQLTQLNEFKPRSSNQQQPSETLGAQTDQPNENTQTFSDKPHSMELPAGWSLTGSDTQTSACDPTLQQTVETYANGQETLTVYINGSPAGCDNAVVADVYYDFNFTTDNSGITIDTSTVPPFCTKEDNPACPKGDGKVTVFVGNQSSTDPSADERNEKTNKTYYFKIEDTGLEADLNAQAVSLARLAATIKIN